MLTQASDGALDLADGGFGGGERGEDADGFIVNALPVGGGEVDFERGAGDKTDPSAKAFR